MKTGRGFQQSYYAQAETPRAWTHCISTKAGNENHQQRQQTVESVFGIIEAAMGFRQVLLRGVAQAGLEWNVVCLARHFRRLHVLGVGA